jgi:hypothetical protein
MDIKVPRFEANEIAKNTDFEFINDQEYANLCVILEEFLGHTTNDIIIAGLICEEMPSPSMNVQLTRGMGYCRTTGKIAHTGSTFGPIAITSGGAQDRIDLVEIRLKETDYDQQQRAKKDPVTGDITYQDVYTKTRFEIEAQVIQGTEGAGVAPNHTSGWVKITEISVDAGETTSILDADIANCNGGIDGESSAWTNEASTTFRLKTVEGIKSVFRVKHQEDGDHKNDVIQDKHVDWGTGANQVSAVDMPIADAGSVLVATEVEAALQEIAKAMVPVGIVIPWIAGYFADGNNGSYTPVSITLQSNYKECDGSALNDPDSPIFNGAGRYLPNLTDDRFLMGNTSAGAIGGDNAAMAHTHGFTAPTAHGITQPTFTFNNHKHQVLINKTTGVQHELHSYDAGGAESLVATTPLASTYDAGTNRRAAILYYTFNPRTYYSKTDGGGNCTIGTSVGLSNNHSGGSVNAVSESRTNKNIPKYLSCKYVMRIK